MEYMVQARLVFGLLTLPLMVAGATGYCPTSLTVNAGSEDIMVGCSFPDEISNVDWYDSSDPSNPALLVSYEEGNKSGPGYESGNYDVRESGSLWIKSLEGEEGGRNITLMVVFGANQLGNSTEYVEIIVEDPEPADYWIFWMLLILLSLLIVIIMIVCIVILCCRKCRNKNKPKELKDEEAVPETLPELKQLMPQGPNPEPKQYTDRPDSVASRPDDLKLPATPKNSIADSDPEDGHDPEDNRQPGDGEPVSSPTYSITEEVFHLKPVSPLRQVTMVLEENKLEVVDEP